MVHDHDHFPIFHNFGRSVDLDIVSRSMYPFPIFEYL